MLIRDCMTTEVEIANPEMSIREAAQKMRDGDFGFLPVGENDRLVGMITDRDITVRAVAESKDTGKTKIRDIMTKEVLYCFEDQDISDVAQNMGDNQVRRLPVLSRGKRVVGVISLGDIANPENEMSQAGEALSQVSRPEHHEPQARS